MFVVIDVTWRRPQVAGRPTGAVPSPPPGRPPAPCKQRQALKPINILLENPTKITPFLTTDEIHFICGGNTAHTEDIKGMSQTIQIKGGKRGWVTRRT